ncbi:RNA polymerase sigma-70 factor [Dinghuibacter silviterrae]|uniref:RNA polymerase sigma-70 factor (ECF subfamily) n=1 Tax=Dinghuibacter silviterrae TaxID=1539049 RepID=A0A4R8DNN5_9BACT|nr:RNA polymerase sigma-70 factor [Dinghuibacter silviterrae]TDW99034.1 RNA polymerase sigma-70 factor (ECF subfamily) [Dinghuibacter silviterrae]
MEDIHQLIKRWLQKDEKAFEQVFYYYYPRLYRYAFRYLKNEFWAEELSMEVLTRVWERRSAITHAETFENYLFTAARNHLINHWQRKIDSLLSLETLPADAADAPGRYDPILSKELETFYHNSLSDLPPQRRLIFLLHRNDHLSYNEIALKLKISPKTVENHIGAALKQLRVAMLQYLASVIL